MEKTDTIICPKKKKQELKEYHQNYREAKKSQSNNQCMLCFLIHNICVN